MEKVWIEGLWVCGSVCASVCEEGGGHIRNCTTVQRMLQCLLALCRLPLPAPFLIPLPSGHFHPGPQAPATAPAPRQHAPPPAASDACAAAGARSPPSGIGGPDHRSGGLQNRHWGCRRHRGHRHTTSGVGKKSRLCTCSVLLNFLYMCHNLCAGRRPWPGSRKGSGSWGRGHRPHRLRDRHDVPRGTTGTILPFAVRSAHDIGGGPRRAGHRR